jgi:non-specific serine/threonine protein kinase
LRQWIADHGRTAPLKIRIEMAVGMARSLDRIHRMGIIHRDIKPANFLVVPPASPDAAPTLKLTDFGIGQAAVDRALSAAGKEERLHGGGACFSLHDDTLAEAAGAYFFIAPELVGSAAATRVRLARNATPASDIYSLGVTLYQLFAGDAHRPPGIDLGDLPDPVIRQDVRECLRRDPAHRPTGASLAERLLAYETRRTGARACAACGEENDEGARFCDRCGASLPLGPGDAAFKGKECAACNEINDLRARYCDQCGRAFPVA